jgi:hypothetical protein
VGSLVVDPSDPLSSTDCFPGPDCFPGLIEAGYQLPLVNLGTRTDGRKLDNLNYNHNYSHSCNLDHSTMIFARSQDDVLIMKSERSATMAWYYFVDWALVGYCFFLFGSTCYFIQGLASYVSEDLYPAEDGVIAACIFIIESTIYIFGWLVGRRLLRINKIKPPPWYTDWNFWGNLLFWLGSWGYLFTDTCYMLGCYPEQSKYMNVLLGILFVFDSVFYTLACFDGETSRAPAHMEFNLTFDSTFDWYLAACTLFIVGSCLYLVAAIQDCYEMDTTLIYFVAAVNFMVDSVLYLMSAFHRRDPDLDEPICSRGIWIFTIYGRSSRPPLDRKAAYHVVN